MSQHVRVFDVHKYARACAHHVNVRGAHHLQCSCRVDPQRACDVGSHTHVMQVDSCVCRLNPQHATSVSGCCVSNECLHVARAALH